MWFNFFILWGVTLCAGLLVFFIPKTDIRKFKGLLAFSGAYLFAITVVHLLPELYRETHSLKMVSIIILVGFFIQMVLEYFSEGIEHGHIHIHDHDHGHGHHHSLPFTLFLALCVHSFLEGTLMVHPGHAEHHEESHSLMLGLLLHKVPEALALMVLLAMNHTRKRLQLTFLLIYSLASPIGLWCSEWMSHSADSQWFEALFALVAGNFLYISTTIFFEQSPDHKFAAHKLFVSALGAATAVAADYWL